MCSKVICMIQTQPQQAPESEPRSQFLPSKPSPVVVIPLHSSFQGVSGVSQARASTLTRATSGSITFQTQRTSKADPAVASLPRDTISPSEEAFYPTDPTYRKMEAILKQDFEASSATFRASLGAAACFARVSLLAGRSQSP